MRYCIALLAAYALCASAQNRVNTPLGTLESNKVYAWEPYDFKFSKTMQDYLANFIKRGDPNGSGLPKWPTVKGG